MTETKRKIKLKFPVSIKQNDGSTKLYEEIEIGRLKNKHMKLLPKDFFSSGGEISPADLSGVIASLADIPIEVADEIDLEDTVTITESLESFFATIQGRTGKK